MRNHESSEGWLACNVGLPGTYRLVRPRAGISAPHSDATLIFVAFNLSTGRSRDEFSQMDLSICFIIS